MGTWYLSELNPETNVAFGLCDLGTPELGYVSIDELQSYAHTLGAKLKLKIRHEPGLLVARTRVSPRCGGASPPRGRAVFPARGTSWVPSRAQKLRRCGFFARFSWTREESHAVRPWTRGARAANAMGAVRVVAVACVQVAWRGARAEALIASYRSAAGEVTLRALEPASTVRSP